MGIKRARFENNGITNQSMKDSRRLALRTSLPVKSRLLFTLLCYCLELKNLAPFASPRPGQFSFRLLK